MHFPYSWVLLQSRRGMKELDLILQQFNHELYGALSPENKKLYHQMLQEQDGDLWDWFLHLSPPPSHYAQLVDQIAPSFT